MKSSNTMTIGLDLGDRFSQVCVLSNEGEVLEESRARTNGSGIRSFFGKLDRARVALEVGTHSPWVSQKLRELGHEVIVANPRRVKLISEGHRKSDRIDAQLLARLARVDPNLLAPIHHRSEKARRNLVIVRARNELVQTRTALITHVRGLLKSFGTRLPKCTTPVFPKRARAHLDESLLSLVDPTLNVIEEVSRQIVELDREIERLAEDVYSETEILRQVDGVGALTALTYVLTLEDKHRFAKSREVGAYLGMCPRRSQSGDKDPELRISKTGDKYLRRLLITSAHRILGPRGLDSDLRRWGLELAARGKRNAKKKAIVAVARRLAVLLHRLWVTGEVYQPIGHGRQTT